jgi:sporulation protein YlmC with PRC-barrel domain
MILCAAVFLAASLTAGPAMAQQMGQQEFPSCILGEEILDMPMVTMEGESVGEIEDVIFDRKGKIKNFIVEFGGFLDIGDKEVAISTDELRYDVADDVAVYQGTRADLDAKPEIQDEYAYGYGYPGYARGYYPYSPYGGYGYYDPYYDPYYRGYRGPYGAPGYGPRAYYGPERDRGYRDMRQGEMRPDERMRGDMQRREMERRSMRQDEAMRREMERREMQGRDMRQDERQRRMGMERDRRNQQYQTMRDEERRRMEEQARYNPLSDPNNLSMENIIDASVGNRDGEIVSEVENLIIDNRGNISHAILDVGGFLGIGDKLVTVPFNELRSVGPYFMIYPGTEEHLENLPAFEMAQMTGDVPRWCAYQREQGQQTQQQQQQERERTGGGQAQQGAGTDQQQSREQ